jgi:predicted Zn-dependent protease with MMP-like domain
VSRGRGSGFERHVRRALDSLPPEIAAALENLAIVVEDEDPDEPDLYGVFEEHPYFPAKITIYRKPLQREFREPAELERQIRITVLHEVAHYFGIEEERLDELGYA